MNVNILVVDKEPHFGMGLLSKLSLPQVKVIFVDNAIQAIKNVKSNDYDIIILGDRLDGGSAYDVGLEIKTGRKNKSVPIVCAGRNVGRATKLMLLLGHHSFRWDPLDNDEVHTNVIVDKLKSYLSSLEVSYSRIARV